MWIEHLYRQLEQACRTLLTPLGCDLATSVGSVMVTENRDRAIKAKGVEMDR
jgi:hypothetical protein